MSLHHQKRIREIRKILSNLESRIDIIESLKRFKDIVLVNEDNDLIVLVIQKVHSILYSSYNIEYIEILLDIIHSEEAFDELFRIIFSFENRPCLPRIINKLRNKNELIIFKYLKELKNNRLFNNLSKEMDKRYNEILDTVDFDH
ncbi:hypothetical protein EROM_060010 [Encephalitozoon romaleae SJ-2008]|uniref:Uncharacterized protein n=1 Tax=Encephalitozoon romaleae (strain SJ-2008) TaxID=1178016 RepID=I6ZTU6_ENCRO|nr:hypothetical protein EROM_060010 [Encephalitozoon romaleae SJ-2008]AFN83096.1 hypothetical protein EROM_060010 [Encephalitozoon romaleae SJ-2008]